MTTKETKHPGCYVVAASLPVCHVLKEATKQNKNQNAHKNKQTSCLLCFPCSSNHTKKTSVCLFAMLLLHVFLFEQQKKKKEPVCLFTVIKTHPKKSTKRKHLVAML